MNTLRERRSELVKFGTVGGIAFIVDLGLFNILNVRDGAILADRVVTAKAISAAVATLFAWVANRLWTFAAGRTGEPLKELVAFGAVNVVALLVPMATVAISTYAMGLDDPVSKNVSAIIGIGLGTVIRYVGYRVFVFTGARADA